MIGARAARDFFSPVGIQEFDGRKVVFVDENLFSSVLKQGARAARDFFSRNPEIGLKELAFR